MNAQDIISSGILELYCMELTSAAETAEVVQWAKQYPEVAAEIEAIQSGLEKYARTHAIAPAASVKDKVMASVNTVKAAPVIDLKPGDGQLTKIRSISPAWKYAAAASIILLAGSLILNYIFYNKFQSADNELASTQTELQKQKAMAKDMDEAVKVMGRMDAMPVALKPMPDVSNASARIYWMQNTKEVFIDPSYLPEPPKGKQYEFWAIVNGVPVNGGIITKEINGKTVHVQQMKSFGNVQAFAVSLEDAGPAKKVPAKVMAAGNI